MGGGYDLRITRRGRSWAVFEGDELVCICVYRRGAREVVRRLIEKGGQSTENEDQRRTKEDGEPDGSPVLIKPR